MSDANNGDSTWRRMIRSLTKAWLATTGAALLLLAAPFAEGQTATTDKVARVGLLLYTSSLNQAPKLAAAFRQGLRERGWVEGRNLVIEERWAEGKTERLAKLATELVRLKVDVIVAPNPWATVAAKSATATIPVVMIVVDDPVQAKLVASLARPGGNVTGLTATVGAADIIGKQLELLTQSVPNISRVTLLKDPTHPFAASALGEAERAARSLRVHLQTVDVRSPDDFESAFALMVKAGTGAIVAPPRMLLPHAERLATLATKHRLPVIFGFRQPVEAGGFMSYGPDFADLLRRVGVYVDKILAGANPGDLPVEQPTKFELVINLKAAKALGLAVPAAVLARADQVIE
jgi:putative ABC transport system substrate-binding protein